jgi:hypothetical protein
VHNIASKGRHNRGPGPCPLPSASVDSACLEAVVLRRLCSCELLRSGHSCSRTATSNNGSGTSQSRGGVLCRPPYCGCWESGQLGEHHLPVLQVCWLGWPAAPAAVTHRLVAMLQSVCSAVAYHVVVVCTPYAREERHGSHGTAAQADGRVR